MSYQVNITNEADRDLRAIFEYMAFELLSVENAENHLNRLEKAIRSLDEIITWASEDFQ